MVCVFMLSDSSRVVDVSKIKAACKSGVESMYGVHSSNGESRDSSVSATNARGLCKRQLRLLGSGSDVCCYKTILRTSTHVPLMRGSR